MRKARISDAEIARQAADLVAARKALSLQNEEKAQRIAELVIANLEKARRVAELVIANEEKAKRAAELAIANAELVFQNEEKSRRAAELVIAMEGKARMAAELAISRIEAINNDKLRTSLMETIDITRQLVELRDPYTAGHEKHVGDLARAIAEEMRLDASHQEGLMVAGYLHDLGKIIVPVEILSKPGRFSREEYNLVKNHVQAGYDLLKNVTFPWPIAHSVLEHHERLDGSGYPNGLKGDQISLEGRILAVSDIMDAMGCSRPYRTSPGIENALTELRNGRGRIYDERVVDACTTLFRDKGYSIPTALA
jgi:putative nucleotidyltransferase with HDIG domain